MIDLAKVADLVSVQILSRMLSC